MKLSEAQQYVTVGDIDVDISRLVTDDEFGQPSRGDYRKRVVDRLVGLEVGFRSDQNTLGEVAKRYLSATCPYCQKSLAATFGGGASAGGFSWYSLEFKCKCGAAIDITLPPEGISFTPPPEKPAAKGKST